MNTELLFTIFNNAILIPWLLLMAAPRWAGTQLLMRWQLVPFLYGMVYSVLLIILLITNTNGESLDFTSFDSICRLFTQREAVLLGWIHYLAFDLFVGTWELKDAQERGIPHYFMIPCLVATLMFGPMGFMLYWLLRLNYKKP